MDWFDSVDAIEIENPLALADQIVQAVDYVQTAMQADISCKEKKLAETRKSKKIVAAKVQELKLEQRFYQEKAIQLSTAQTEGYAALAGISHPVAGDEKAFYSLPFFCYCHHRTIVLNSIGFLLVT